MTRLVFACSLPLQIAAHSRAMVINVPADQPTIQAGINAAHAGDTVLVAPETYNEAINFNGKAITVSGSDGARATTINAAGLNTSVVKFVTGEGPGSVLHGFTITGGTGTLINSTTRGGGGIYILNASPKIQECRIVSNTAAPPNRGSGFGGGIYANNSNLRILDCLIASNSVIGTLPSGGGMRTILGSPVVLRCVFLDNHVTAFAVTGQFGTGNGGGTSGSGTFIECAFQQNGVSGKGASGGGASGGLMYVNCVFAANAVSAAGVPTSWGAAGGGISASNLTTLINCTIVNNTAAANPTPTVGGVAGSSGTTLRNCIVFGNSYGQVTSSAVVTHSSVQGGFVGDGNIDADPEFVDPGSGDYRLAAGSACIDVGDASHLPADAFDLDGDGNTKEAIPHDLDGLRRVVNGFVDMGAYEWQHACAADISPSSLGVAGDGTVNVYDVLTVINGWGSCDGCVADVNGDNSVNVDDLLAVINAWGACP